MLSAGVEPVTNGGTPSGAACAGGRDRGFCCSGGANGTRTPPIPSFLGMPLAGLPRSSLVQRLEQVTEPPGFSFWVFLCHHHGGWGRINLGLDFSLHRGWSRGCGANLSPRNNGCFPGVVVSAISDEVGKVSAGGAVDVETDDSGAW